MKIKISLKNSIRVPGNAAAMFPGTVRLHDGRILLLFSSGSGFESSDCRLYCASSCDNGTSWQLAGKLYEDAQTGFAMPFTDYAKPALLPDGTITAAGYGFFRDQPQMGLSDYAEKFGRFPEVKNFVLRSRDNGKTWDSHQWINHAYPGMEISGPPLVCANGKMYFFAAPFCLEAPEYNGYAFESSDSGLSWQQNGIFFSSPHIIPWETRAVELPTGRIVLVIWAFDSKAQKHLNNHIMWSDDGGRSWSHPIDTGLRGQASNFLLKDGQLFLLQSRREGDETGLCLNQLAWNADETVETGPDIWLWKASGMANKNGRIEQQFAHLKFGQPSIVDLGSDEYLLFFWCCTNDVYSVQAWKFTFEI